MRIIKIIGLVLGALILAAWGVLYAGSEYKMNRKYEVPLSDFVLPDDPGVLAEGERLARIRGCIGCHGANLEGAVFFDQPWLARIVTPDLTRMAAEYSDAELERVIRKGVRRDGRSVWAMPSPMYAHLADEDLGAMLAYIRSVPAQNGFATEFKLRLFGRIGVLSGEFPPLAEEIDPGLSPVAPDRNDPLALGRYLAMTSCSECHGGELRGSPQGDTPSLAMVAAYSPENFVRLMREGVALGERELPMMSGVSRYRFSHFTDAEIGALHSYLPSLAGAQE
jgi:mono/diheme cytochrome c family protein